MSHNKHKEQSAVWWSLVCFSNSPFFWAEAVATLWTPIQPFLQLPIAGKLTSCMGSHLVFRNDIEITCQNAMYSCRVSLGPRTSGHYVQISELHKKLVFSSLFWESVYVWVTINPMVMRSFNVLWGMCVILLLCYLCLRVYVGNQLVMWVESFMLLTYCGNWFTNWSTLLQFCWAGEKHGAVKISCVCVYQWVRGS